MRGARATSRSVQTDLDVAGAALRERWPDLHLAVAIERDGDAWRGEWRARPPAIGAVATTGPAVAEPGPRFLVYSVTKTILAALVLRAVDAGRTDLDAPIRAALPALRSDVTVRQLLRHTAGLADYGGLPAYHLAIATNPGEPWSFEALLADTLAKPAYAADAGWGYSNLGYLVVRRLVETVYDAPLARVVAEELAGPLGLAGTSLAETRADLAALVPGFSRSLPSGSAAPVDVRGRYHPGWVAHGVVASTAADLARLVHAVLREGAISTSSVRAMTTWVAVPVTHPRFVRPAYGLGLQADPGARRGPTVGHTGEGPGYAAAVYHAGLDARATTVAVLANAEVSGAVEGLALSVLDAWAGGATPA